MIIEQLKTIFPSLISSLPGDQLDTTEYSWFSTEQNELVGIPKKELNDREKKLLTAFLTPFDANRPPLTTREKEWMEILFEDRDTALLAKKLTGPFRFIYFSLSEQDVDPFAFREAIDGIFPVYVPVLWVNSHEGLIIEESSTVTEDIDFTYDQMVDVLMSDFYIKPYFYISSYINDIRSAANVYQWVKKCFHTAHRYTKSPVLTYIDAVPYLLMDQTSSETDQQIITSILQETAGESELLHTIHTFLECNSNATLAARQLYMHRNSLQYRVDKFIEKTGIDIKQFSGALTVYLALMLQQKQ